MKRSAPQALALHQLPPRLHDLDEPPGVGWLWGQLSAGPAVAVVGTRYPTREALKFTRALVHDLGRAGVSILSGGAQGIDRAAHEAALDVDAHTLVVAPAGLSKPYPSFHRALYARVLRSGGGYLSITPDGEPAQTWSFFGRNAVLAALAHVVVAIESGVRSGTRNTASWARRLGRPIFWPAASPWDTKRAGFLLEYRLGGVQPLRDARDVLRCLSAQRLYGLAPSGAQLDLESVWDAPAKAKARKSVAGPADLDTNTPQTAARLSSPPGAPVLDRAQAVLARLEQQPETAQALMAALQLAAHDLERVLIELTLEGHIERDSRGRFRVLLGGLQAR